MVFNNKGKPVRQYEPFFTDAHHLFLSNDSYNSSRSNKPYDNCDAGCSQSVD